MNTSSTLAIAVENLFVFAGDIPLLGPVTFNLNCGETLVIMGETGAGKSLIAQAVLGILPKALHAEGLISINGQRVDVAIQSERAALWGRDIATLPQEPWRALDPLMTAAKQVEETYRFVANRTKEMARRERAQIFDDLGLDDASHKLPSQMSGGMAQRVAFAAATAGGAPILIADEPTKGLDFERNARVVQLLKDVPDDGGALLTITHEASVARALGGRIMVMRDGRVVEARNTAEVLASPGDSYTYELIDADPAVWPPLEKPTTGGEVIAAEELTVARGELTLIEGFSLKLHRGERIAITGPSGVGKTSLLDTLAGMIKPIKGTVVRASGLHRFAVQKLYQDPPAAFPPHILLERSLRDVAKLYEVDWQLVVSQMNNLNLDQSLLSRTPDAVSGGELQRLSIVRALITNPKIILADEPTSRLDPITQRQTLELLADIASKQNIAMVLVTHNHSIANKWAHRTIEIKPGE